MANPCSPNTSEPKPGLGTTVLYDAAQLANFLLSEGMGWMSPFVPQIGGTSVDLPSFCAADPPPAPTTDAATIANFFSPLNPTGAADLKNWLVQVADYFLWYADCQCSAGTQPTPPTPIPQPTDVNITPPNTGAPGGATCYTNSVLVSIADGDGVGQPLVEAAAFPSGGSAVQIHVTADLVDVDGSFTITVFFQPEANGVQETAFPTFTISTYPFDQTFNYQLPYGATALDWTYSTDGATSSSSNVDLAVSIYCGTTPYSMSSCCAPDTNTQGILQQILDQLTAIYSIIPVRVPNYAAGTAHSGLSGGGSLSLDTTTIALKVVFDTLPPNYGLIVGSPDTYFQLGWISPNTNEGVEAGFEVTRQTQIIPLPEASSGIEYSFATSASVTITELQAG